MWRRCDPMVRTTTRTCGSGSSHTTRFVLPLTPTRLCSHFWKPLMRPRPTSRSGIELRSNGRKGGGHPRRQHSHKRGLLLAYVLPLGVPETILKLSTAQEQTDESKRYHDEGSSMFTAGGNRPTDCCRHAGFLF